MASSGVPSSQNRYPAGRLAFPHRDLTGIAQLERHEILFLLDEAEQWVELNRNAQKHREVLSGLTIINAFFENSTRTLLSFEIAGKRLGADVVNMHAATSSVKKGETLIDTAITLNAMRADGIVITPSHNPPRDGGFKYTPPDGGPAGGEITGWVERRANEIQRLITDQLVVQRLPADTAR